MRAPLAPCNLLRYDMQHVRQAIVDLRRYIATCEARSDLHEVDTLLSVALEEVRRKIAESPKQTSSTASR